MIEIHKQVKSIKDYVLGRVLPDVEGKSLQQLEGFLEPRLKESGMNKTVQQLFEETHQEMQ